MNGIIKQIEKGKPFFEKIGYSLIKEQQVEKKGIFLTNYVMEKYILK